MTNISEVFRIGQRNSQVFQKGSGPLWWVSPCRCASLLPRPRPTCCAWEALTAPRSALHWVWWAEDSEQWVRAEGDKGSEERGTLFLRELPNGLMSELHCWEIVRFVLSWHLGTSWFYLQASGYQHNSWLHQPDKENTQLMMESLSPFPDHLFPPDLGNYPSHFR